MFVDPNILWIFEWVQDRKEKLTRDTKSTSLTKINTGETQDVHEGEGDFVVGYENKHMRLIDDKT